jgi:polyferredoxin
MRIVIVRRVSQAFFLTLFVALSVLATYGDGVLESRGWPIGLFLELDPLTALGTLLTTQTVYRGLLWAVLTVGVTALLGRVFCGWVCPFGTLHHVLGWLGRRKRRIKDRIAANRFRALASLKYSLLVALLLAALVGLPGTLLTGWLDPIAFLTRALELVILPLVDRAGGLLFSSPRIATGAWLIGALFLAVLLLNLWIPRFYCRFLCPLGALLGLIGRWAPLRFGRDAAACTACGRCERDCEGASTPSGALRQSECLQCANCLEACPDDAILYGVSPRSGGEIPGPELTRRGFAAAVVSGIVTTPLLRLDGRMDPGRAAELVRPPGSRPEREFLSRCISCGRCMRACPTNVLQPASLQGGLEGLWTPVLDMRRGTSGCQLNCVACGQVCPTGAIRPLGYDEKMGTGDFAEEGPLRMGLAVVDRDRCLPWAFGTPCIVCEENCPVSPKAIRFEEVHEVVPVGALRVREMGPTWVSLLDADLPSGRYGTGDYTVVFAGDPATRRRVAGNTLDMFELGPAPDRDARAGPRTPLELNVRVQRPVVVMDACNGCGICEHECPVRGLRAIRVTAENESRSGRRLNLRRLRS